MSTSSIWSARRTTSSGHGHRRAPPGDGGDRVVERLQVLDVDRGDDVDARRRAAPRRPASGRVRERRGRCCGRARRPGRRRRAGQERSAGPARPGPAEPTDSRPAGRAHGSGRPWSLDDPDHHVGAALRPAMALGEHGVGLADAGRGAEVDPQPPARHGRKSGPTSSCGPAPGCGPGFSGSRRSADRCPPGPAGSGPGAGGGAGGSVLVRQPQRKRLARREGLRAADDDDAAVQLQQDGRRRGVGGGGSGQHAAQHPPRPVGAEEAHVGQRHRPVRLREGQLGLDRRGRARAGSSLPSTSARPPSLVIPAASSRRTCGHNASPRAAANACSCKADWPWTAVTRGDGAGAPRRR